MPKRVFRDQPSCYQAKEQGLRKGGGGGQGGQRPRGPWTLGGQGAQQRAHRNDPEKSACERPKTFFFGDHIKIRRKRWHFSLKTFFLEITSKFG